MNEWYNLHTHLLDFHPNPYLNDTLLWRWSTMGKFSVHSNYVQLEYGGMPNNEFTSIWSSKIPLKVNLFSYIYLREIKFLQKKILLLRDGHAILHALSVVFLNQLTIFLWNVLFFPSSCEFGLPIIIFLFLGFHNGCQLVY